MTRDSKTSDDRIPLESLYGERYFINVASQEDNPDSWCVVVGRETKPSESNTNVVRIDTDHGRPHIDKLWLRPGSGRKEYLLPSFSVDDAIDHLRDNWKTYVYRYVHYREEREVDKPE